MISSDIWYGVLPDGHSEAAEEALAVDDDGALSMVFRTLLIHRPRFTSQILQLLSPDPYLLLCHSLLCRDSSLVQNLCDHHSRGVLSDHSGMASKRTGKSKFQFKYAILNFNGKSRLQLCQKFA